MLSNYHIQTKKRKRKYNYFSQLLNSKALAVVLGRKSIFMFMHKLACLYIWRKAFILVHIIFSSLFNIPYQIINYINTGKKNNINTFMHPKKTCYIRRKPTNKPSLMYPMLKYIWNNQLSSRHFNFSCSAETAV